MANICDIFFQHNRNLTDLMVEFFHYNLQNNRLSLILFSVIQGMTLFLSEFLRQYPYFLCPNYRVFYT